MAIVIRKDSEAIKLPGLTIRSYEIDFDSSYPTGGEAWDLSADFDVIKGAIFEDAKGFKFELTSKDAPASSKVKVLTPLKKYSAAVNPASLATDAVNSTAVTVTGVLTADDELVSVQPAAALEAGIVFQSARVTANDEITVEVSNTSAGTVDAASATADFYVRKKEGKGGGYEITDTTDISGVTKVGVLIWGKSSK